MIERISYFSTDGWGGGFTRWTSVVLLGIMLVVGCASEPEPEAGDVEPPFEADLSITDEDSARQIRELLDEAREEPGDARRRAALGMAYEMSGLIDAALASYDQAGWQVTEARLAGFASIAVGGVGAVIAGKYAERFGRTLITSASLFVSGLCCILAGFLFDHPLALTSLCLIWGFAVVADSAQFSAAISELADPSYVGTALTIQTSLGLSVNGTGIGQDLLHLSVHAPDNGRSIMTTPFEQICVREQVSFQRVGFNAKFANEFLVISQFKKTVGIKPAIPAQHIGDLLEV